MSLFHPCKELMESWELGKGAKPLQQKVEPLQKTSYTRGRGKYEEGSWSYFT